METQRALAATFAQLTKLYNGLSPGDAEAIAAGTAKIAVVRSDQRIVEASPIVDLALKTALANTEAIAAGTAKIAVVRADQRVVEASPMVDLALKAARAAKPHDIERAASGGSSFKLAHKGGRVVYPVNVAELADDVSRLGSEDAIVKFLSEDGRLKAADLKKIGAELGIPTPSTVKKPEEIIAHIARSIVAFGS